jgi:23S rRNA (cytosine1962-C5)-methyltransferase
MVSWYLKPKEGYAHRLGHPWVFSNQLKSSPKSISPGQLIELKDEKGKFVSFGYGHPHSLIAFRELSRSSEEKDLFSAEFFYRTISHAFSTRELLGLGKSSARIVFGEADYLPGLIIDRFVGCGFIAPQSGHHLPQTLYWTQGPVSSAELDLWVIQPSTAGMDQNLNQIIGGLELLFRDRGFNWKNASVVYAPNSSRRELESLPIQAKRVLKEGAGLSPSGRARFFVDYGSFHGALLRVEFETDFIGGQKTGFFLDQRANVLKVIERLGQLIQSGCLSGPVKVLDLCAFVGQWSAVIKRALSRMNTPLQITLIDESSEALDLAKINVGEGAQFICSDVFKALEKLPDRHFDLVICDPPAFIKKRRDIGHGLTAYTKLHREALRVLSGKGLIFSSSCSHLLTDKDYQELLAAAARKSRRRIHWIERATQGPDHPLRFEFPEGHYLKGWIGLSGG